MAENTIQIRQLVEQDWEQVCSIYLEGIATGQATFETEPPDWAHWNNSHLPASRVVAISGEMMAGWAALSRVSTRCVYDGVAEVSVYVAGKMRGGGIGTLLLETLVKESEQQGIWTLQAGIFPENLASISLHKLCGFREVGTRERVGKLNGIWRDTLLLERRSKLIATD